MVGTVNLLRAFLVGLTLMCAPLALAAQSQLHQYDGINGADGLTMIDGVSFDYDVQLNLGLLFGEAVVGSRLRWRIDVPQTQVEIPAFGIGDDPYETVRLGYLGLEAPSKIRIYNVKIEYQLSTASGTLYLLSDAGDPAPGDGQAWSFNVPESPNWTRMFHRLPLKDAKEPRDFVSKSVAIQAMRDKVTLVHARVLEADISFYDLHNWYARETDVLEAIAVEKAIKSAQVGVFRSFGYRVNDFAGSFFPPSTAFRSIQGIGRSIPSLMSGYLETAEPHLAKLIDVPNSLRTSKDTAIYDQSVHAAQGELAKARQTAHNYRSTHKDPDTFRKGSEVRTSAPGGTTIVDRYATAPDGQRLSGPYKTTPIKIIADLYVASGGCLYDIWSGNQLLRPQGKPCDGDDNGGWSVKDDVITWGHSRLISSEKTGCASWREKREFQWIDYDLSLNQVSAKSDTKEKSFSSICLTRRP